MHTRYFGQCLSGTLLLGITLLIPQAQAAPTGAQIYQQRCAACHGPNGQGVAKKYAHPLVGNRSVAQLAHVIGRSMPKNDPGSLAKADVQSVARYIYDAFYSPAARDRLRPAHIELARLTVRQYRNAVADLLGTFEGEGHWDNQRGLRGQYFRGRGFRRGRPALERVDPQVRFDFGTASPEPAKLNADQFAIRWQGGVLAPETGDYEFIVRTEHAARLWVNDTKKPLIDAWVKSGNDTEYRASLFLLGGRVYSLRLEFAKGKQGVADKKKPKKADKASIALEWRPPHRAVETIPTRDLSPNRFPTVFVVTTPFPPDDRSVGYERGTSISRAWDQATTDGAIEVADAV
ncbi:MAG TPA: PA14 domain-containing protein, partial [Gemmataceae bacterium]|nr:PA14 domain-containing protein [Gemmataceae bacterium]